MFAEHSDHWDTGLVVADSLRKFSDWNDWIWQRPTVSMLDYAVAVSEPVRQMFLVLAQKAGDQNLPPLCILLLEREADAKKGWFHDILELENKAGGGPVRDLFEPTQPVSLPSLDTPELRRMLLQKTLHLVHENNKTPLVDVPNEGDNLA